MPSVPLRLPARLVSVSVLEKLPPTATMLVVDPVPVAGLPQHLGGRSPGVWKGGLPPALELASNLSVHFIHSFQGVRLLTLMQDLVPVIPYTPSQVPKFADQSSNPSVRRSFGICMFVTVSYTHLTLPTILLV